jgi:hypothetical protein
MRSVEIAEVQEYVAGSCGVACVVGVASYVPQERVYCGDLVMAPTTGVESGMMRTTIRGMIGPLAEECNYHDRRALYPQESVRS